MFSFLGYTEVTKADTLKVGLNYIQAVKAFTKPKDIEL